MAIIVPNTASTFSSAACVVGSESTWVWVSFVTPITASGSVMFWRSASPTAGRELIPIVVAACQAAPMYGPFNSPCGIYASPVGGCAIVWMKVTQ